MKLSHVFYQLIKRYNKDSNPDIEAYREYLHDIISTENHFFPCENESSNLCVYMGETDKHFVHKKIYNLVDLGKKPIKINKYKNFDFHIKKVIGECGLRYILLNYFDYHFIEIGNNIPEAVLHNAKQDNITNS